MLRQRLTTVMIALVVAQVLYALLAMAMLQGGFKAPRRNEPGGPLLLAVFLGGMCGAMFSLPAVKALAKRQPVAPDFTTTARGLLKQFFVGYALAQTASLAGLLIFFLYADLKTLLFLVWVAATAIVAHFLRIKKAIEEFEEK